jgi:hypothetical protein
MNKLAVITLLCSLYLFPVSSAELTAIPVPDSFKTTMNVNNEYPMVQIGYSSDSISAISQYYQQQLGEPQRITDYNGYRTLFYSYKERNVRISLYQRQGVTEVSIMIE